MKAMILKKRIIKKIIFGVVGTLVLFIIIIFINLIILEKDASVVSKGQPIENFSGRNAALIVIDIQESTTGEISMNPFYKKNSEYLINNINRISEYFKGQNLPVIYVRSEITDPLINLLNSSYAKGSAGAKYDKRLNIVSGLEVVKNRNDAFRNSNLDNILTGGKINELYIVGLDASECVNTTVEAALNRNYKVKLIEEGILSKSTEMKDSMIVNFKNRGVKVISMDSLKLTEKHTL